MDHRWGQRVAVDLAVQLLCHPRTIAVGRLMNVSVSGAYVRTGLVPALTLTFMSLPTAIVRG